VIESPQILGWNSLTDWSSQVRLVIKTTTDKSDLAGRVLRQYALEALQQAEIPLALPSREAGAASPR
jgi:small-conductance mechanosensitive channel